MNKFGGRSAVKAIKWLLFTDNMTGFEAVCVGLGVAMLNEKNWIGLALVAVMVGVAGAFKNDNASD